MRPLPRLSRRRGACWHRGAGYYCVDTAMLGRACKQSLLSRNCSILGLAKCSAILGQAKCSAILGQAEGFAIVYTPTLLYSYTP